MEPELAEHCGDLDRRFYEITRKQMMMTAFDYAAANGVSSRFNSKEKMAWKDWLKGFYQRQNLPLCTPKQCSLRRAVGFSQVQCVKFFENLELCYETKGFKSHWVFNMDESGISTVMNKIPKMISPIGNKDVCKVSSGERGDTVSVVCCFSPTAVYIPPAMIFPRKE
jgi:hypothetical protein